MKSCKNCNEYTCGSQGSDNVSMVCGQNENKNLMTYREKLIELLLLADPNPYECEEQSGSCELTTCTQCRAENTADILLSHGVVVRDKGEWALEHGSYGAIICPICKHEALLEQSRISTNLLYVESNFCPACGADLRGEQHEP